MNVKDRKEVIIFYIGYKGNHVIDLHIMYLKHCHERCVLIEVQANCTEGCAMLNMAMVRNLLINKTVLFVYSL